MLKAVLKTRSVLMSVSHVRDPSSEDSGATIPTRSATGPTPRPALSRKKRLAFGVLSLVLAWSLCEVGGFFLFWLISGRPFSWNEMQDRRRVGAGRPGGPSASVFAQAHPYVGYVEEPSQDSGVRRLADGQPVPVSEFGYIDDKEPIQARGRDRVVVGITGGSVASYFAVNGSRKLGAELSKAPAFTGKRFVFVNLALGGYKQPQQLMTLAYLLSLGAEFDIIINIDGFNEVALYELENASHHIFPAFPRSWQARIGITDLVLGSTRGRLLVIEEQRSGLARWCSRAPWRYSVLCNLVWDLRDRRLEWDYFRILESYYRSRQPRGPYAVTGPRRDFATPQALYEHLAMIWANSSTLMDRLCRGKEMRYYHFLQPNQYVAGSKPMGADEKRVAILMEHPYRLGVERGYPLLIRNGHTLEQQGISYHDLTGIFSDHPEAIYVDGCCHLNQAGYEIMAEEIARTIIDEQSAERH
jgi:hypothetical protein